MAGARTLRSEPKGEQTLPWEVFHGSLYCIVSLSAPTVRTRHTEDRCVVLSGDIWRPWNVWLSRWFWRPWQSRWSRDSLGLRRQLWHQLSGRLCGSGWRWQFIQLRGQRAGKVTTQTHPSTLPSPPLLTLCFLNWVSPSLQGAVAQPGYGAVRGNNQNSGVREKGRLSGRV